MCPLSVDRTHLRHLFIRFAFPIGTRSGSIKESLGQRTKCLPLGHHSCYFISISRNFVYKPIVNLHKFGSGEGSIPTWGSEDFSYATRSDRSAHLGGPLLGLFERQRQLNLNSTQLQISLLYMCACDGMRSIYNLHAGWLISLWLPFSDSPNSPNSMKRLIVLLNARKR